MPNRKPTPETQAFGEEVARHRKLAELSRAQLAALVTVTTSYVGIVETGVTRCRYDFAQRLDLALGTGTVLADAWNDLLRGTNYPQYFVDFTKAEHVAAIIRTYQCMLVYGLLQTEGYARALLLNDSSVEARMTRQHIITREDPLPPKLYVLLDESVLYRQVGDRSVMREQLRHLTTVGNDRLIVQVVPQDRYYGAPGSFVIATPPGGGKDVAYLANLTGGHTSSEPADILGAVQAFTDLQAHALSVGATRDLIGKVVEERWMG
ncbi:helix-turn-helix transcriptional regulator [Actinocorallia longicatena]|uniref:Helix-turn-helix transcriptional regulator n=1 Tax=Actinocorallia longicatena TaxID=111803 RepID=A0ABP6QEB0_9ACTN